MELTDDFFVFFKRDSGGGNVLLLLLLLLLLLPLLSSWQDAVFSFLIRPSIFLLSSFGLRGAFMLVLLLVFCVLPSTVGGREQGWDGMGHFFRWTIMSV